MKSQGFTLIELLIAITLGIVLLGIAIPRLSSLLSATALDSEANTISNTFRSARSHSIDLNQRVVVCFTDDSASEKIIVSGSTFDPSIDVTPDVASVIFSSEGSASAQSVIKVCYHDINASPDGKTVTVALSGRTTISNTTCN
jgi:prepilin-type N-terminal cleavage/methylation domain-containing protein